MPFDTTGCGAHPHFSMSPSTNDMRSKMRRSNTLDSQSSSSRSKAHRKLKESCNECGYAKVKCSKEKPQCSRCKERGLSCGYDFSSRAGRRLASSRATTSDPSSNPALRQSNTSSPQHQHYRDQSFTASPSLSPTIMHHNPTLMPGGTSDAELAAFGYFSDAFGINDYALDYLTPSASPVMPCSMDMPIDPMMDFSHLDPTTQTMLETGYFNDASAQMNPIFTPANMMSPDALPVSPVTPDTPISSRQSSVGSAVCHEVLRGNSSCLSKMLNVLAIQERGHQADESGYGSGASSPVHHLTSVEDAIHANRTILDAAASTLDCHCLATSSQLIYLLVSTAFDVMSRYAKAASYPELVIPSPSLQTFAMTNASGSYPHTSTDAAPARLVFGELHKVLRFIDLLAQRFQELNSLQRPQPPRHDSFISGTSNVAMSTIGNINSSYKPHDIPDAWKGQVVCVSVATFHSLESDLRQRLKEIRDGILAQLRSRTL